jgi:hypothetical protein
MERRTEARYKIDATAELKYGATTLKVKAVEISKRGIRIESTSFIEPGKKIEAVLFLKEPQRVAGEVKWVLAEPGPTGIVYKIGIFCITGKLVPDDEEEEVGKEDKRED